MVPGWQMPAAFHRNKKAPRFWRGAESECLLVGLIAESEVNAKRTEGHFIGHLGGLMAGVLLLR